MRLSSILFLITFLSTTLCAQIFEKQEQFTWGSRIENPVTVEVVRTKEVLSFYADNKSIYPYQLELEFKQIRNLSPIRSKEEFTLHAGRNLLFKFTVSDPSQSPVYNYTIRYRMGDKSEKADENFSYLFPIAKGSTIKIHRVKSGDKYFIQKGTFEAQPGDTVFAIRKGIVAATPDEKKAMDRIMANTLEVKHADGTIAVYSNVDSKHLFVQSTDKVYPGQPIGIVGELDFLRVSVLKFMEGGKLEPIDIKYAADESKTLTFTNIKEEVVQFPAIVIEKELNDREIKKYRKGNLYPIAKGE